MKRRLAALLVTASVFAAPAVVPASSSSPLAPGIANAKPCSTGWTHAVMPDGAHKCLRAGQFCSRKATWQRAYRRVGYYCAPNGHLKRL